MTDFLNSLIPQRSIGPGPAASSYLSGGSSNGSQDLLSSLMGFASPAYTQGVDMGGGPMESAGRGFFNGADGQQGYGGALMSGLSSLGSLALGLKQYGIAKDTLNFQKDAFNKNFGMQKATTMDALRSRQDRRVIEGRTNAAPTNDYLASFSKMAGG
jgi:hypothetical protein